MPTIAALAFILLTSFPALGEPLHSGSTGADFMAASEAERTTLLVAIAPAFPGAEPPLAKALLLRTCLVDILTAKRRGEREGVAVLREKKLNELAAACVIMFEASRRASR